MTVEKKTIYKEKKVEYPAYLSYTVCDILKKRVYLSATCIQVQ